MIEYYCVLRMTFIFKAIGNLIKIMIFDFSVFEEINSFY